MPRHRSSAAKLLLGAVLILVGCADVPSDTPMGPEDLLRQGKVPAAVVCSAASPAADLIDCLFPPPGLRNAAQQHLKNIVRQYDRGKVESARGMMFDFVDFVLSKKEDGQLLDAQPLGQAAAVSLLFDALFESVGLEPPEIPPGALTEDGAASVVGPAGGSVFTGTKFFGLSFQEDAVPTDVLVTLERLPDPAVVGDGPLPTGLDQYGPFYSLHVSPAVDITGVITGLCYYHAGPLAPPDDPEVRSQLKIARTVPGTDDKVKILAWAETPSFIDCSDVTQVASLRRMDARALARLGIRAGSFLARALGPAPLRAQTLGSRPDTVTAGGGRITMAVIYGTILQGGIPGALPDLVVESIQVTPAQPTTDDVVKIDFTVKNIGDANAGPSTLTMYLGGASQFQADVGFPLLVPGNSITQSFEGHLPAGAFTSAYAKADALLKITEYDEDNNDRTFSITVAQAPQGVSVSGVVQYSSTPLSDIVVALVPGVVTNPEMLTTVTDKNGAYSFTSVLPGTYHVKVYRGGEYANWVGMMVQVVDADVTQNMDLPKKIFLHDPSRGSTRTTTRPELTWAANPEADDGGDYRIQINKSLGWDLHERGSSGRAIYQVQTPVTPGVEYTWQVDAYDSGNHWVGTTAVQFTFTVASSPAGEAPDQVSDGATGTTFSNGGASLFQSFTPAASELTRVRLRLRAGGLFPEEGYAQSIRIRSGSPTGTVLATVSATIPASLASMGGFYVDWALPTPLAVTPEQTYVIEFLPVQGSTLSWYAIEWGPAELHVQDPYTRGAFLGIDGQQANEDMIFVTFSTH